MSFMWLITLNGSIFILVVLSCLRMRAKAEKFVARPTPKKKTPDLTRLLSDKGWMKTLVVLKINFNANKGGWKQKETAAGTGIEVSGVEYKKIINRFST